MNATIATPAEARALEIAARMDDALRFGPLHNSELLRAVRAATWSDVTEAEFEAARIYIGATFGGQEIIPAL